MRIRVTKFLQEKLAPGEAEVLQRLAREVVRQEVARHGRGWVRDFVVVFAHSAERKPPDGAVYVQSGFPVAWAATLVLWRTFVARKMPGAWEHPMIRKLAARDAEVLARFCDPLRTLVPEIDRTLLAAPEREALAVVPAEKASKPKASAAAVRLLAARKKHAEWERRLVLAERRVARAEREVKSLARAIERAKVAVAKEIG